MNLKNTLLKYTVVAYDNSIFKWFVGDSVIAHFTRFVMIGTSFITRFVMIGTSFIIRFVMIGTSFIIRFVMIGTSFNALRKGAAVINIF